MTSRTPAQISSDIIAKLAITSPGLSLEVGTPERKIVDAVAESIAEAQVDNYLISTQLDIDTKSGQDLEDWVGTFGFGRYQGQYAVGEVTLTLSIPATDVILISAGSQFYQPTTSAGGTTMIFASTSDVTIPVGASSATIPLQCSVIGTLGNVAAGAVTGYPSGVAISSCVNQAAFTGGTDDESDEDLRARFKKTFLRNLTGTEDFYIAICLQMGGTNRVKVLGPVSTYTTQIQTGNAGVLVNVPSPGAKYIWANGESVAQNTGVASAVISGVATVSASTAITAPSGAFDPNMTGKRVSGVGIQNLAYIASVTDDTHATLSSTATAAGTIDLTIIGEQWYVGGGSDYTFPSGSITQAKLQPGTTTANVFLDVTFEYCSVNSRNDPRSGKSNKVDIFVDGITPIAVNEQVITNTSVLNTISNDQLNINNYQVLQGTVVAGDSIQRLGSMPILSWPSTVKIGSNTYTLGTHYAAVRDISTNRGSEREMSGIVWPQHSLPTPNQVMVASYTYNQTPQILNAVFKRSKQITSDVLVHQAIQKRIRPYFIVMYDQGSYPQQVNANIIIALTNYVNSLGFGAWIQLSDLVTVAHNVNGVDNIRFAHASTDGVPYTMGIIDSDSLTWDGVDHTTDFQVADNAVAVIDTPVDSYFLANLFIRRSFNNFNS
jgi:hypothetical protein